MTTWTSCGMTGMTGSMDFNRESDMAEPTAANLRALEKTVQSYEQSIADLEAGVPVEVVRRRWLSYGFNCLLCISTDDEGDCDVCALYLVDTNEYCNYGEMRLSQIILKDAILNGVGEECTLLGGLKSRLKAILKRVDQRGYELVQVTRKK